MRQAGEPTVEEILDSIKKVIARDNRAPARSDRPAPAAGAFERQAAGAERPGAHDNEDVLDLSDGEMLVDGDRFATETQDEEPASLIGEETRASMRESLAALSMLAQPGAAPQIVRSGETSLEGLVRDMLRPMLAQWLDQNLPPMVERLVAAEIARIVRKQG